MSEQIVIQYVDSAATAAAVVELANERYAAYGLRFVAFRNDAPHADLRYGMRTTTHLARESYNMIAAYCQGAAEMYVRSRARIVAPFLVPESADNLPLEA